MIDLFYSSLIERQGNDGSIDRYVDRGDRGRKEGGDACQTGTLRLHNRPTTPIHLPTWNFLATYGLVLPALPLAVVSREELTSWIVLTPESYILR